MNDISTNIVTEKVVKNQTTEEDIIVDGDSKMDLINKFWFNFDVM
jgi:hypothetical protein